MNDTLHNDPLMHALSGARPPSEPADRADAPNARLLFERVVATPGAAPAPRRRSRARRVAIATGAAAALVAGALLVVNTIGVRGGRVVVTQPAAVADVAAIARASTSAFTSGRADMTFDLRTGSLVQKGNARIAFSGNNRAVTMTFEGADGRPGFTSENRTVDGAFYLLDGAPGAKRWYHETNAVVWENDTFDLNPRDLLTVLRPAVAFELVDTQGDIRDLRAARPSAAPEVELLLGPVPGASVTNIELWVGPDDDVQRLVLDARRTETPESACMIENGKKTCLGPGDLVARANGKTIVIPATGPTTAPQPVTTTASFDVRFHDVGAAIPITAPANAIPVAGQG
jgi:hypothetical protein